MSELSLQEWLMDQHSQSVNTAVMFNEPDTSRFLANAEYFARALRMYTALKILRACGSGDCGFDEVALEIYGWIDGGIKGPVPWPDSPFFAEWAGNNGLSKVGRYVGFKVEAKLVENEANR